MFQKVRERKMNKRVYGVLGISSVMANWNADFSGYPKSTSDGTVFGSDKAFKYPMKKMWQEKGEKVLYIKSMKLSKDKEKITVVPRSLTERYEHIFNPSEIKKGTDSNEILKNLFHAIDVKNFGATFAEEGNNFSITGAVQIGQGMNKYEGTEAEEQQILSPFRDASDKGKGKDKEEAKNSTLGTKIVSNEAHYFYPFAINPAVYNDFIEMGVTEGYTEEDYKKFKEASLCAATAFATNAKLGCENEFALFVETKEETYLPNLAAYIDFVKGDKGQKNQIIIHADEILSQLADKIDAVEIYFNRNTTELVSDITTAKLLDIFTLQEV